MLRESWLEAHPYLQRVADLAAEVECAAAEIEVFAAPIPDWISYRADYLAGVPLLSSADAGVDLEPGSRMAAALLEKLAIARSSGSLVDQLFETTSPTVVRYVGWTAMRRYLRPVVAAFDAWRDGDKWLRRYCPTCGSLPAMAQLVGADPGRMRLLSCGCCGTRWQFKRTGCPFCETDAQRLSSLTIDKEPALRIDHCESCRGYLKTYDGQGDEAILLADWSSLHLDLIAQDRGLRRLAGSLFDFDLAATTRLSAT